MATAKERKCTILQLAGLISIGWVCWGYITQNAVFAQKHIQFSFLDFPIFIGEFLCFFCLLLVSFCWLIRPPRWRNIYIFPILYGLFVIAKTIYGYQKWGPLACRHAAMHYYPIFILFGLIFFQVGAPYKEFLRKISLWILTAVLVTHQAWEYWDLTIFLLVGIFLFHEKNKRIKYLLSALVLISTPYWSFFNTARMFIVGNFILGVYVISAGCLTIRINAKNKIILASVFIFLFSGSMYFFAGKYRIRSIIHIGSMYQRFTQYDALIQQKKKSFRFKNGKKVTLFHPKTKNVNLQNREVHRGNDQNAITFLLWNKTLIECMWHWPFLRISSNRPEESTVKKSSNISASEIISNKQKEYQDVNNAVFRLLIWRDMAVEFMKYRPIFGFDFGKPLRSMSLETLNWGGSEWGRDGWVAAHNSYLHNIYRTGIVGLFFLGTIFVVFGRMAIGAIIYKSYTTILLCGILLSWFAAANFLVILEVPYTAIPIWTLFGITLAHFREVKENKLEQNVTQVEKH